MPHAAACDHSVAQESCPNFSVRMPIMKLSSICEQFIAFSKLKQLSDHSLRAYRIDLQEFTKFAGGEILISDIDRHLLRRYLLYLVEQRKLKETSVKRRMACLKVMFRWLELDDAIAENPFHKLNVRIRLPHRLPRSLTRDETEALRRAAKAAAASGDVDAVTAHTVIEVFLVTGVRVGELSAARLPDLDLADESLVINGKGNRQRRVFLPTRRLGALMPRYLTVRAATAPDHDVLFVTAVGNPIDPQSVRRLLRDVCDAADLRRRVTPHMLRHTAATQLLEAGVDIRFVQRLLGHQSISTTEIYTTVTDEALRGQVSGVM